MYSLLPLRLNCGSDVTAILSSFHLDAAKVNCSLGIRAKRTPFSPNSLGFFRVFHHIKKERNLAVCDILAT